MDGYNLVLTSAATGSSGSISIASNTAATQILGLQSGKVTGNSGENAVLERNRRYFRRNIIQRYERRPSKTS